MNEKTKKELTDKIERLKITRTYLILATIALFGAFLILAIVGNGQYSELKDCQETYRACHDTAFQMCNNFNSMAGHTEYLIIKYMDANFSYEELPNCTLIK